MKLIDTEESIDLSEKVRVEMTLREIAVIHAIVGRLSDNDAKESVDRNETISNRYKPYVKNHDLYDTYVNTKDILTYKRLI